MRKLITLFIAAALVFAVSCKKDKQTVLSASDAQTSLTNGTTDITSDLNGITSTQGYEAISNVTSATTPFNNPMKSMKVVMKSKNLKSLKAVQSGNFNFSANTGTYNYIPSTDSIRKVSSTPTTEIVINFPSDSIKKTVNDAVLTISAYTSVATIDSSSDSTIYLPTLLTANIAINGVQVVNVNYTATYTSSGVPTMLNATISVVPYTLTASYTESGANQNLSASLKNSSKTIAAVGGTITYTSATVRTTVSAVSGYAQLEDIKLQGNANIKTMSQITNPTAADFNANSSLTLTRVSDGAKIGDIKAYDTVSNGYSNIVLYIVFSNGSKALAQTYLTKIEDQIPSSLTKQ